jgi:hypothetical protein
MKSQQISEFFEEKVPKDWFTGPPQVDYDDEEILCVGTLPAGASIESFRESTREARIAIAFEAESRFGKKVSWGVERDGETQNFTTVSTPVMTRLRMRERSVLDTLVEGGVARSRSDALAWCVKLVSQHEADWLAELREALADVEQVRNVGPRLI